MTPDRKAMEKAVAEFLSAAGLSLDDPNLADTPARVTAAFANEFLDGYEVTAKDALGPLHPLQTRGEPELVVVTHLTYRSMCPHHLLPFWGRAHIAYLAKDQAVGFGRLSTLLDAFAHRLVLQEELAHLVAHALMTELGSPGAACILEAQQLCFQTRGPEQQHAITHAEAFEGIFATEPRLRDAVRSRIFSGDASKPVPKQKARAAAKAKTRKPVTKPGAPKTQASAASKRKSLPAAKSKTPEPKTLAAARRQRKTR